MENPYKDVKELGMRKWILKKHGKGMILTFLFISIFMVAPWIGQFRIEETWLRLLISGLMLGLNILATFIHPWTIYKKNIRNYDRWRKNHESGIDKK